MRSSSHRSSSTFNTGMLSAARVNPTLRRRVASSRPRRCGIKTTSGADIGQILFFRQLDVISSGFEKKGHRPTGSRFQIWNFLGFPWLLTQRAAQSLRPAGLEDNNMSIGTIILIILIIALLGGFSGIGGGPFYGTGYYGGGGLGLIIVILLILVLLGRI